MGSLNKGFIDGTLDEAAKHAALSVLSIPEVKSALHDAIVHDLNSSQNPLSTIKNDMRFDSKFLSNSSKVEFSLDEYQQAVTNSQMVKNLVSEPSNVMDEINQGIGTNNLIASLANQEINVHVQKTAMAVCMDARNLHLDIDSDLVNFHIEQNVDFPLEIMNDKQFELGAILAANTELTEKMKTDSPLEFATIIKSNMVTNDSNTINVLDSMIIKSEATKSNIDLPDSYLLHKESLNALSKATNSTGLLLNVTLPESINDLNANLERAGIDPSSDSFQNAIKKEVSAITSTVEQGIQATKQESVLQAGVDLHTSIDTKVDVEAYSPKPQ